MDQKHRIKLMRNLGNPQNSEFHSESPLKQRIDRLKPFKQFSTNRPKSELYVPHQGESISSQDRINKYNRSPSRHIFSKLRPIQFSLQQKKQNRNRSKTVPQQQQYRRGNSINLSSPKNNHPPVNKKTQIQKFPHYVSKSNQMVETKQKLLQLKHRIKFNNQSPLLESIQNSINIDRAGFTRKMKVQICKKGNTSLMEHFQKDLTQLQEYQSPSKLKSKDKTYRSIDLPYLIAIQHRDQNVFENYQRMQKMEEIKRNLKAVRKSNLKHPKSIKQTTSPLL